jgi:hypothetical protein
MINDTNIRIELGWYNGKIDAKSNFVLYSRIRKWFHDNNVIHNFEWVNTGNYFPDYLIIEKEFATVFKLTFDL